MEKDANPGILDRQLAAKHALAQAPLHSVVDQVVDYGTQIIMSTFESAEVRGAELIVAVGVLAKDVVAKLDGAVMLARSGCNTSALPVYRSLLESDVTLRWILQSDTKSRSTHYWVAHLLRHKKDLESQLPGGRYHREASDDGGHILDAAKVRAEIARVDAALQPPSMATALGEVGPDQRRGRFWASALGPKTFEQLCEKIDAWTEYEIFYRMLSGAAHGIDPRFHVQLQDGTVGLESIRDQHNAAGHLLRATYLTIHTYHQVLTKFQPGELLSYSENYRVNWRPALMDAANTVPGYEPPEPK